MGGAGGGRWNRLAPPVDGQSVAQALQCAPGSRGQKVQPYGDAAISIAAMLTKQLTAEE